MRRKNKETQEEGKTVGKRGPGRPRKNNKKPSKSKDSSWFDFNFSKSTRNLLSNIGWVLVGGVSTASAMYLLDDNDS